MSTIVTRAGKGTPLTNTEVDSNFTNLNSDKLEKDGSNLASKVSFDVAAALTPATGQITWDADTGTVDIGLAGATAPVMSVGEDQFYRVINQTGSTIAKGTLVMAVGTVGNSGKIKVAPWNGAQPSKTIMGLVLAPIPTEVDPTESGLGYVLAFGKITGIQTNGANYSETWVNGDIIYAGAAGGLTKTIPAAPNTKTTVAIVISSHASNGTLFIRPSYGSNLGEDELVQLASLAAGDVLSYDSVDGRFENKTLAAAGIYATTNPAGYTTNTGTVTSVGGTGTVNGITLTGTVTSTGDLTLGGTLSNVSLTTQVTGTLPVANGGTGLTTLTANNVILGNDASTPSFVAPGTNGNVLTSNGTTWQSTTPAAGISLSADNTWTGTQTFSGSTSKLGVVLSDVAEVATVSATAATGTIAYDITTQSVRYYTSNASANWTVNFRASSGTSLNTALATGQSVTVAFLVTQGATAYYNNVVQVDGTTSGVTTRWIGGAPTAGNASGIDSYRYLIIKTGSATFTVLASVTQFKA